MGFILDCDTCDFGRTVDDEGEAYVLSKEHESEHGGHFVLIETVQ